MHPSNEASAFDPNCPVNSQSKFHSGNGVGVSVRNAVGVSVGAVKNGRIYYEKQGNTG